MIFLLLNEKRKFETDGEALLKHILCRLSLHSHQYVIQYCYYAPPPTKAKDRTSERLRRKTELENYWLEHPCSIVGMGKYACEMLFTKGVPKRRVGTKWTVHSEVVSRHAWYCVDPAAALFDPNLCVDISAIIYNAAQESGDNPRHDSTVRPFNWSKYL